MTEPNVKVIKYRGDVTGDYDDTTGTGIVGKVVGPDIDGHYRAVIDAKYDVEDDVTYADAILIPHPDRLFERLTGGAE